MDSMRALINLVEQKLNELHDLNDAELRRLAQAGFDIAHPLYHGSDADFTEFDRSFARTANHIYTSPDPKTAGFYGKHLYLVFGRTGKCADMTDDYELLGKLADVFQDEFHDHVKDFDEDLVALKAEIVAEHEGDEDFTEWDAEDDPRFEAALEKAARSYTIDLFQNGKIYEEGSRRIQDDVMSECFSMGYTSVFFYDHSSTGSWESIVFDKASDVVIAKKLR